MGRPITALLSLSVILIADNARSQPFPKFTNSVGMEFVRIPPGTFMMGSSDFETKERPVHQVTLTRYFWIGTHEAEASRSGCKRCRSPDR